MININLLIKDGIYFTRENNTYHFISDENDRPWWSKALDNSYDNSSNDLFMESQYEIHNIHVNDDIQMIDFFQYITSSGGIIVDLASGPSGYFSPVFNFMKEDSIFIATDASKNVINAHQKACKDTRFLIFDINLDNKLPFKDESIDVFSANLLNNVDNYRGLLMEISRSLKPYGRFAVIELFYEFGTKTYDYLKERNAVFSSLEDYIAICKDFGLKYKGSKVKKEIIGRIAEGDLFPIGENDKCLETIVFFEKEKPKK